MVLWQILKGSFPYQHVSEFTIHDEMLTGPLTAFSMYTREIKTGIT